MTVTVPASEPSSFSKKLDDGQSPKKENCVNLCHALLSRLSTHDNLVMQMLVGSAKSSSHQSGSILHTLIQDLIHLSTKFKEKTSSCSSVNTVFLELQIHKYKVTNEKRQGGIQNTKCLGKTH